MDPPVVARTLVAVLVRQPGGVHGGAGGSRGRREVVAGADLAGPDSLVLVEQEEHDPGGVEQVGGLGAVAAAGGRGVAGVRGGAQVVRVVADQQVQAAGLGVGGGAEVLEELLGGAGAVSGGLARRGGEGLRAGGVPGPVAGAQGLTEEGQREGTLGPEPAEPVTTTTAR